MTEPPSTARVTKPGLALAALAIAQTIIGLDYNIVFVALPDISNGIGFDSAHLQWTISAYTVAFGGFLLLGGRCADLIGRRRMLHIGLSMYAVGSILGGLAQEPAILLVGRAIQGLGGAALAPAVLSLVTTIFSEGRERNRALGVWGAAGSSGMVLGSLLGGVLTEWLGWRSVFFVNLPVIALVLVLAARSILADNNKPVAVRSFDLPGAVTVTLASTSLVFALVQGSDIGWAAPGTVIGIVAAIVLYAAFLVIEARSSAPLIPLKAFRHRNLVLGAGITFSFMATVGAIPYFLTTVLQNVYDYSPFATGLAFILPCVGVLGGTMLGARLASTIGLRSTLTGSMLVAGAGIVVFAAALSVSGGFAQLAPGIAIFSVAQGVIFTGMYAAATTGLPDDEQGLASGVASSGQQIGGAVGLAILVAVSSTVGSGKSPDLAIVDGAAAASYVAGALIVAASALALRLRTRTTTDTVDSTDQVPACTEAPCP